MTRSKWFGWALLVAVCSHALVEHAAGQSSSIVDALDAAGLTALAGAVNQTGANLTGFTGVVLAPTDAAFQAATLPEDLQLVQVLQYHLLNTTTLPTFNASSEEDGDGVQARNVSVPGPYPDATPGWPTLLPDYNVTITVGNPDAYGGDTPYYFYSYADQPGATNSSQCLQVSTSNTTNATLCVIDRVLIPVPANETIANYLSGQPQLSTATQLALQFPTFASAFASPDVVTTFFVPTNDALAAYVAQLEARDVTSSDEETFNRVVSTTLAGHFGLSLVPYNGEGSTSLATLNEGGNTLVVNDSGVTSVLANGTEFGPVPLANGTRVGKAYVYTIETVLETGALDAILGDDNDSGGPEEPSSSPSGTVPSPSTTPTAPIPPPSPGASARSAWVQAPLLLAAALLALLL